MVGQTLEDKISRYLELLNMQPELKQLKNDLDEAFKDIKHKQIGPYLLTGKEVTQTGGGYPQPKIAKVWTKVSWVWEIEKVDAPTPAKAKPAAKKKK